MPMENQKTGGFWSDSQCKRVHFYSSHFFLSLTNPAVLAPITVIASSSWGEGVWWAAVMSFGRAKCVWEGASGDGHRNDNCSNCLFQDQMGDDLLSAKWDHGRWQNKVALLSFSHLPFICMYAEERAAKALCWAGCHDHSCTLHPLIWIAAAPRHPLPLRPFLRLPFTMQLSSKTPNQTASAIGPRSSSVPVGTSDERWQRVGSTHPSVFALTEPLRLNRSPEREAECRPVRWDEAQPRRCLISGHPGTTH